MNLTKLYKMQQELDQHILENNNIKMSKEELLDNTILALLVEVGELANTTRCFKHWSKKGMMEKEVILDELSDVWHFYLSVGNQLDRKLEVARDVIKSIKEKNEHSSYEEVKKAPIGMFKYLYESISNIDSDKYLDENEVDYYNTGGFIIGLQYILGFTDKEVELAYLKKHEENYKRQAEGY